MWATFSDVTLLVCRIIFDLVSLSVLVVFGIPRRILAWPFHHPPKTYRSILITGASAGIGEGLALRYSAPGVRLVLTAWRHPSLERVAMACRALGAEVETHYLDVGDTAGMAALVEAADDEQALDLVVANAGIVGDLPFSARVVATNMLGLVNTVVPASERMRGRGSGQIVVMSSMGGFAPATNRYMTAYLATKAGANSYAMGTRAVLAAEGVGVTLACPGFVKSRMTDELGKQGVQFYGLWSTGRAVEAIVAGAARNAPEVTFPLPLYVITRLLGAMPAWMKESAIPVLVDGDPFSIMDKRAGQHSSPEAEAEQRVDSAPAAKASKAGSRRGKSPDGTRRR